MNQTSISVIKLKASDGCYLTQSDDNIEIKDRIVGKTVYLGKFDSPENWKEITEEKANEYIALKDEYDNAVIEQHRLEIEAKTMNEEN